MRVLEGDTPLRIASVALAVALWFFIAGQDTAERGVSVPVELRNVPPDLELTGDPVNTVDVRLRASPGLIESLDPGQILAAIDLKGAGEGEHIVQLTPEAFRVPFGFRIVKITPSLLTLNLEHSLEKTLPVRPRILGRPAPGYEVVEVRSEPAQVRVLGPKSRVQEIESAFTEPVSVEGLDTTVEETVNVGLEDPLLRLEDASEVKVIAKIREVQAQRTFDALPLGARGQPASLGAATVRVVVGGPASVVEHLSPDDVRPYVNVPSGLAGERKLPVAVEISPGHAGAGVVATVPAEITARPPAGRKR